MNEYFETRELTRKELLAQGKGKEAIQYAIAEKLPFGDRDIFEAMQAIMVAQDTTENKEEFDRLAHELDEIENWRLGQ